MDVGVAKSNPPANLSLAALHSANRCDVLGCAERDRAGGVSLVCGRCTRRNAISKSDGYNDLSA